MNNEEKILKMLSELNSKVDKLDVKVDKLDVKVDSIKDQLTEFEVKNANNHIESIDKIRDLTNSVEFLKYEELKTKEDVFTIKKHLTIIK
jgi:outer membrane murein-binding lipoprotein Lpp